MEHMPNTYPSLFAAYAVIWTLIVAYVLYLSRKVSRLEKK